MSKKITSKKQLELMKVASKLSFNNDISDFRFYFTNKEYDFHISLNFEGYKYLVVYEGDTVNIDKLHVIKVISAYSENSSYEVKSININFDEVNRLFSYRIDEYFNN